MTTATHTEREHFVAELIRHAPKAEARHAQRLMRCASAYWRLVEKQNRDLLALSQRERSKLQRIKHTVLEICETAGIKPVYGAALHIAVDTGNWNKIVRVPCI